ncbi:MAG TPA: GLPGLI family protein [Bacteroidetes bacterium]|nr:GLPGLI family protein [Bacteroidota bacterium]
MKSIFLVLAFILPFFSIAQQTEGEIVYDVTVKLNIELPEDMAEAMKDQIPSSQSFSKALLFTEKATLYDDWKGGENEDLEIEHESDGMEIKMVMTAPENIYYSDLENGTFINSRDFFGRMFLINGDIKKYQWKLTGDQQIINGYTCQKATCQDGDRNITAWFTPQIPIPAGPSDFNGLPGLILKIDIDNGEQVISPTEINIKKLDKKAITAPSKGKKVSQKEFDKIEETKKKEMEEEMGGSGGGMKVIIRN